MNNTYYYKVRAYTGTNGDVYSDFSAAVSSKPVLSKPVLSAVGNSYNSIYISWNRVVGAAGYQLYRSTSLNGSYTYLGYTTNNFSTNRYLTTGRTYYYKLRAYRFVNGVKIYSEFSAISSATPYLNKPTNMNSKRYTSTSIRLSWYRVSGAYGYEIYRSINVDGNYSLIRSTTSSSYINYSLRKGNTYYYKVRAYRIVGGKRVYGAFTYVVSTNLPI